jgi:hypothetical protein
MSKEGKPEGGNKGALPNSWFEGSYPCELGG